MRKNLRTILLLLTIMTTMCIFVGCGDGRQDDSALLPEPDNQSAEQLSDAAGTGNDEEWADYDKQENNTNDGQDETEKNQLEDMQDKPEGKASDKSIDAAGDRTSDNDSSTDESTGKPSDTPTGSDTSTDECAELSVYVESIGDNSVVGNKITIESGFGGNNNIMVVGGGDDNKVLIPIHLANDASYVYRVIRNGGADVDTREGSFSDLGINMILDLTGYYKGEDFYADKVVISNVIID